MPQQGGGAGNLSKGAPYAPVGGCAVNIAEGASGVSLGLNISDGSAQSSLTGGSAVNISKGATAGGSAAVFSEGAVAVETVSGGNAVEICGDVVEGDSSLSDSHVSTGMLYDTYYFIILLFHLSHIFFSLFITLDLLKINIVYTCNYFSNKIACVCLNFFENHRRRSIYFREVKITVSFCQLELKIHVRGGRKKSQLLCSRNPVIEVVPAVVFIDSVNNNLEEITENADNVECISSPVEFPLCDSDVSSLESNQDESLLDCDLPLLLTPSTTKINSGPALMKPLIRGSSHKRNKRKFKEMNQSTKGANYPESVSNQFIPNIDEESSDLLSKKQKITTPASKKVFNQNIFVLDGDSEKNTIDIDCLRPLLYDSTYSSNIVSEILKNVKNGFSRSYNLREPVSVRRQSSRHLVRENVCSTASHHISSGCMYDYSRLNRCLIEDFMSLPVGSRLIFVIPDRNTDATSTYEQYFEDCEGYTISTINECVCHQLMGVVVKISKQIIRMNIINEIDTILYI